MTLRDRVEALLLEGESTTLDFKREQYRFIGAADAEKSELLKDTLAFANAFRRTDAYILIGVEDVPGSRAMVVGLASHIDDATLQQFVNTKTNRPVEFSYSAIEFDGRPIGIIHIPLQQRPVYLMKDFGKLEKEKVYLRRGSSTAVDRLGFVLYERSQRLRLEHPWTLRRSAPCWAHSLDESTGKEHCTAYRKSRAGRFLQKSRKPSRGSLGLREGIASWPAAAEEDTRLRQANAGIAGARRAPGLRLNGIKAST